MPEMGLLRNNTRVTQSFGRFEIAPYSVGRVPFTWIEHFRANPNREFSVVDDDPEAQLFKASNHLPTNSRYRR